VRSRSLSADASVSFRLHTSDRGASPRLSSRFAASRARVASRAYHGGAGACFRQPPSRLGAPTSFWLKTLPAEGSVAADDNSRAARSMRLARFARAFKWDDECERVPGPCRGRSHTELRIRALASDINNLRRQPAFFSRWRDPSDSTPSPSQRRLQYQALRPYPSLESRLASWRWSLRWTHSANSSTRRRDDLAVIMGRTMHQAGQVYSGSRPELE